MIEEVIEKLQAEVETLHHELNVTLPEALEKAIAMGDLKENGDYHAALERQRFVQARLGHLTSRLTKLSQIDISKIPSDRVGLGSKVVVRDMDTKEEEILELVIPDTMDIDVGHISVASPLGSALVEKKVGQVAEARLPFGTRKLKILKLETLHDLATEDSDA
jgi:transcription elongation factor GreA